MGRVFLLFVLLLLLFNAVVSEDEVQRVAKVSGIWNIYYGHVTKSDCPAMMGKMTGIQWKNIEPQENHWDWSDMDASLKEIADMGLSIGLVVFSGQRSPEWLYTKGVTHKVHTDHAGPAGATGPYPYYFTDKYKMYYKRYVTKVRQHIDTLPKAVREKLLFVQAGFGTTDDAIPWHGNPINAADNPKHNEWQDYMREMMIHWCGLFGNTKPHIYTLFNQGNAKKDMDDWLSEHCPGSWRKAGNAGHGYQMNYEDELTWLTKTLSSVQNSLPVAARSELSANSFEAGYWKKAPAMNMFAQLASSADFGLDIENMHAKVLKDKAYWQAFEFYNRHVGDKRLRTAHGGFCALRDALETTDIHRFPEHEYGPVYQNRHHTRAKPDPNVDRMKNIAKAFSSHGAVLNDEHAAVGVEMASRTAKDFNDVGVKIHPGNYERNLHQLNPEGTSVGWWRVGNITTETYGRFARGFDHRSGKNEMHFQLDTGLWGGLPLRSSIHVKVTVAYFDQGHGRWEMHYDGTKHHGNDLLFSVQKKNSGKWKTESRVISDGHFGQRGPRNSDFWLTNPDTEDDIFALVEVYKVDGHGAVIIG